VGTVSACNNRRCRHCRMHGIAEKQSIDVAVWVEQVAGYTSLHDWRCILRESRHRAGWRRRHRHLRLPVGHKCATHSDSSYNSESNGFLHSVLSLESGWQARMRLLRGAARLPCQVRKKSSRVSVPRT
jgi:hypothetical protein